MAIIPKKIHVCWFSGEKYPVEIKRCMDTWKRKLPDYEIRLWTYDDAKAIGMPFIDEALEARQWAFAADVVRFYAVYSEGGVYMDSDIYVYKRFDEFMTQGSFVTFNECWNIIPKRFGLQAALFMGEKGNRFCAEVLDYYASKHFKRNDGTFDKTISPIVMNMIAEKYGYSNTNEFHRLEPITIFELRFVQPTRRFKRFPETFAVHHIYGHWRKRKFGRRLELRIKHIYYSVKYFLVKR